MYSAAGYFFVGSAISESWHEHPCHATRDAYPLKCQWCKEKLRRKPEWSETTQE